MQANQRARLGRRSSAVAVLALGLVLAACGGGGDALDVDTGASAPAGSSSSSSSSGQHCRIVSWTETETRPGYCADYICFNYYTVYKQKEVCD